MPIVMKEDVCGYKKVLEVVGIVFLCSVSWRGFDVLQTKFPS